MGFSIGSFLGAIAGPIGAAFGGVIPTILGAGISAGLARPASVPGRQLAPVAAPVAAPAMTSVVPTPNGGAGSTIVNLVAGQGFGQGDFGVQRRRVGFVGGAARAIAPFFGSGVAAGFAISEVLQRARENTGQRVTKNKIIDSAKFCGIELTAQTFGLSETDVCKVIVAGRSRRRRGISAADVRRTKRTLRFVRTIRADFKKVRL